MPATARANAVFVLSVINENGMVHPLIPKEGSYIDDFQVDGCKHDFTLSGRNC
jgi:hypothetical protein